MNNLSSRIVMVLIAIVCSYPAHGQAFASTSDLPDAPDAAIQTAPTARPASDAQGTGIVNGVVQDIQGNPITGAKVLLIAPGKLGERTTIAGSDGTFAFTSIPAGRFHLIITAPNFETYISPDFMVEPGSTVEAPKINLKVTSSATVTVFANSEQIAQAQLQEQEKQRVVGVFQNFYTSYIWEAEPMSTRQKYKLAFRTLGDPSSFLIVAGIAGAEQYNGTYPGYGPGIEGYGKRYGAALADSATGRIVGSAVLPSLFHQDPRYFYQGSGGIRSRSWHAVSFALVCRGDNGRRQPNFSHLLGNLVAGTVANAYHPESSRGVGLTFETFGITTGGNAVGNLFREFLLRKLEPAVPGFANGKP
jgi:hypothetical protein